MATTTRISVEEYLGTSYRPDMEYIDGELRPKNSTLEADVMVQWMHAHLQALISAWFVQHQEEWHVLVGVEARTRIRTSTYRLPDVVVITAPPEGGVLTEAPLIVIEVLSPRDTYSETRRRARDYQEMGVRNIWLIDPDTKTAQGCKGESWVEMTRLHVENSPIYLDMSDIFERADSSIGGRRQASSQ